MDLLEERSRVEITPKNYFKRLNTCLIILGISVVVSVSVGLYVSEISFLNLGLAGALVLSTGYFCYRFKNKTNSIAIKGDTLILNAPGKPSCVTSVRAIKDVQTSSFLGVQLTRLKYVLDGRTRFVKVINLSSSVESTPELLIKKAMELSKKQKANHKPGSVLTN